MFSLTKGVLHMKLKKQLFVIAGLAITTVALCACGEKKTSTQATPSQSAEVVSQAAITDEAYATAVPGVPSELKDSKYDLTKVLTEPALKDVFHKCFKVGVANNGSALETQSIRSKELAAIMKYDFNSMTFSNLMKPCYLLDETACKQNGKKGDDSVVVNFDSCKEGLDFAKANGIGVRGHVLIWHNQTPSWFFCKNYDENKGYVDKETMLKRMESYIKQVMEFTQTNYPGVIYAWDVVNEAVETTQGDYDESTGWMTRSRFNGGDNMWYATVGPEYVEKAFTYARQYAADGVKLFYNDYNTFDSTKRDAICKLLQPLKQKGLVDGIGMQSAMDLNYPSIKTGIGSVKDAIAAYAQLGLEIHMSEITMRCPDDSASSVKKQAERYEELFQVILAMDSDNGGPANITNVTFFGLMDNYLMYPDDEQYYWLLDNKLQPKESFYSIQNAWKTKNTVMIY